MEALILILINAIGSLIGPLIGSFFTLIGSALAALLTLMLDVVMLLLTGKHKTTRMDGVTPLPEAAAPQSPGNSAKAVTAPSPPAPKSPRRRWTRWLLIGSSSLTALMLMAMVVINLWFIDDLTRWLLAKQEVRTGIVITADSISGNLFTGKFRATGIRVQRRNHPAGLIDLTVSSLDAEIAVWRVFDQPLMVEAITVDGIRGSYERGVPGQAPAGKKPLTVVGITLSHGTEGGTTNANEPDETKKRREFIITALTVTDLEVAYADHTRKHPLALPVTISRLTATPLRSQWAVFDILFGANATGTIAGRPLTLAVRSDENGGVETSWKADELPVTILADQIGGPFALLTEGACDVQVNNHWRLSGRERVIVMDWSVVLNRVKADVPESTSKIMALLAKPAVAFINSKGERVPLSFRVEIDENRFNGTVSAEAAGLWEVVADSAAATLAKALGIETDKVKEVGGKTLEKAKDVLDWWRKQKD